MYWPGECRGCSGWVCGVKESVNDFGFGEGLIIFIKLGLAR